MPEALHPCPDRANHKRQVSQSMRLPTHLHESPVVVHLLGRLEKVAPVGPHGRMLFCDNGCA